MLRILICDDDLFALRLAAGHLKKAMESCGEDAKICCIASSGSELLNYIRKTCGPYLYFLDYDFGKHELNGIDLVRRIYQTDPGAKIVFVTSHADKGMDILKSGIRAFGFMEKVPDPEVMTAEYVKYLKMAAGQEPAPAPAPSVCLPLGIDETVTLPVSEITCVDSVKSIAHTICYHTFNGSEITVRDTLEHARELLGNDFIYCHRSVLINKRHVVSLKNGLVKLSNGEMVSCAMGKRREVAAACLKKENPETL